MLCMAEEASKGGCQHGKGVRMGVENTVGQWGSPAVEEARKGGGESCLMWDLKEEVKHTPAEKETGPSGSGWPLEVFKPVL